MLAFISQAKGKSFSLRASVYEFQYQPVLKAFADARDTGADVKIVYDARHNAKDYPSAKNMEAIQQAGIDDLCIKRTVNPSYISHNKFILLLKNGKPAQIWTGYNELHRGRDLRPVQCRPRGPRPEGGSRHIWTSGRSLRAIRRHAHCVLGTRITVRCPRAIPPTGRQSVFSDPRPSLEALQVVCPTIR